MTPASLDAEAIGLPLRPFLYTLDQIGTMLVLDEKAVKKRVHFEGRAPGVRPRDRLLARNISPVDLPPEWRVAERELVRWLKVMGFRLYERGWVKG